MTRYMYVEYTVWNLTWLDNSNVTNTCSTTHILFHILFFIMMDHCCVIYLVEHGASHAKVVVGLILAGTICTKKMNALTIL